MPQEQAFPMIPKEKGDTALRKDILLIQLIINIMPLCDLTAS